MSIDKSFSPSAKKVPFRIEDERRYMMIYLDPREVLGFMVAATTVSLDEYPMRLATVMVCDDIPADIEIRGVELDYARHAFAFLIYSPSFEPVPYGDIIPPYRLHYKQFNVALPPPPAPFPV